MSDIDVASLSYEEKVKLFELLNAKDEYEKYNAIERAFPLEGKLSIKDYPKHMEFFKAGAQHDQRAYIGGNRTGKSYGANYETTTHLTGVYPPWWEGKRFDHPIKAWAAGFKNNIKEATQDYLLGSLSEDRLGTGFIPKHLIVRVTRKPGVPDTAQDIFVKHISGGVSAITLKTYDEGVAAFGAATLDWIHLDEEPREAEIYSECATRLATTGGSLITTFTPLNGLSRVVLSFLPGGKLPVSGMGAIGEKFIVNVTWDDAPHLSEAAKNSLIATYLPYEIEARTRGIPFLQAGAIYPISERDVAVTPFKIPNNWPRGYAFDPGWERTAALWVAQDPNSKTLYLYDEYYRGKAEPEVHAAAIRARGSWQIGAIDYAGKRDDGTKIFDYYRGLDLNLVRADKAVDAGILKCWQGLSSGMVKVFRNLENFFTEFRLYRKDTKGEVVKENDHLMDCFRYIMTTAVNFLRTEPLEDDEEERRVVDSPRSKITGY